MGSIKMKSCSNMALNHVSSSSLIYTKHSHTSSYFENSFSGWAKRETRRDLDKVGKIFISSLDIRSISSQHSIYIYSIILWLYCILYWVRKALLLHDLETHTTLLHITLSSYARISYICSFMVYKVHTREVFCLLKLLYFA